ncbi:MAG: hypothetical protein JW812_01615 [Alphaproteobacteria bacterium]|nr:hypothetical protein [Alphaproteobacteria bacterium]MBN2780189.1 hypothetical protein [Alphaproteobacteria bacterium]
MMKKDFTFYGLWSAFVLLSLLWVRYVFAVLPSNPAFLNYVGIEKLSLSLLISFGFVPLFFVAFLIFIISASQKARLFDHFFRNSIRSNQVALEGAETISKSLLEMRKIGYTTQFFSLLPIVYQDFYDSLRRILRGVVLTESPRLDSGSEDIWGLCRSFLVQVARDPAIMEDIRRNFKKHDEIAKEFANFQLRYQRLLKALQSYDRDSFVYQFVEEGSLGRVYQLLSKIHERAFTSGTSNPAQTTPAEPNPSAPTQKVAPRTSESEGSLLAGLSILPKK